MSEPQNPNTVRIDILDVEASTRNCAYLSPTEQDLLSQEFDLTFFRQQFGHADAKHLKLITVKGIAWRQPLKAVICSMWIFPKIILPPMGFMCSPLTAKHSSSVCKKREKKCSSFLTTQPTKNGHSRKMMYLSTAESYSACR